MATHSSIHVALVFCTQVPWDCIDVSQQGVLLGGNLWVMK